MIHREQSVFLFTEKWGQAQTPDLTIRKNSNATVAKFNFSPKGCEMWLLKSAWLKRGPRNITSPVGPPRALDGGRGETEEGLRTWSEGTDGRGQMWATSLGVQKNRRFVAGVTNCCNKSCVRVENEFRVSGSTDSCSLWQLDCVLRLIEEKVPARRPQQLAP